MISYTGVLILKYTNLTILLCQTIQAGDGMRAVESLKPAWPGTLTSMLHSHSTDVPHELF